MRQEKPRVSEREAGNLAYRLEQKCIAILKADRQQMKGFL